MIFEIQGQQFQALNGGPSFKFGEGMSLSVSCETQEELDHYWERLTDGGKPGPCGWLSDRYGVAWQIVPTIMDRVLGGPDRAKADRVMKVMMTMGKLDIAELQRAADAA